MPKEKPPRLRMVIIEKDGTKSPVPPFNHDTQKIREEDRKAIMPKGKPPRLRMVIIEKDGTKSPVPPFNRDTQKIREEEAKLTLNLDSIEAGCSNHQKPPEIRRLGQSEKHGIFRRLGDE